MAAGVKRIVIAAVAAFIAANGAFFMLVLPAEFGMDPTGVGRALGLLGLAGAPPVDAHRTDTAFAAETRVFELAPFESVEIKYDLVDGDGLVYAWRADAEVVFDLHAEPAGAEPGTAESFAQGRGLADAGTYVAPYDGIHGWFWENRNAAPVTVTLRSAGFATGATEYKDGDAARLPFPRAAATAGGSGPKAGVR